MFKGPRDQTSLFEVALVLRVNSHHGVGFASTRLPIGKYGTIVA